MRRYNSLEGEEHLSKVTFSRFCLQEVATSSLWKAQISASLLKNNGVGGVCGLLTGYCCVSEQYNNVANFYYSCFPPHTHTHARKQLISSRRRIETMASSPAVVSALVWESLSNAAAAAFSAGDSRASQTHDNNARQCEKWTRIVAVSARSWLIKCFPATRELVWWI